MSKINPNDIELSTQQAASILNISQGRVQMLMAKYGLGERTAGGPKGLGHYRIKLRDLDKLEAAHKETRQLHGDSKTAMYNHLKRINERLNKLEEQMEMVSEVLNELTSPLASTEQTR